jgi:hypothetical protein
LNLGDDWKWNCSCGRKLSEARAEHKPGRAIKNRFASHDDSTRGRGGGESLPPPKWHSKESRLITRARKILGLAGSARLGFFVCFFSGLLEMKIFPSSSLFFFILLSRRAVV